MDLLGSFGQEGDFGSDFAGLASSGDFAFGHSESLTRPWESLDCTEMDMGSTLRGHFRENQSNILAA
jgi:hypothetical protein